MALKYNLGIFHVAKETYRPLEHSNSDTRSCARPRQANKHGRANVGGEGRGSSLIHAK